MTEHDLSFQHCTGLGLISDTTKIYHLSIGLVEATFNVKLFEINGIFYM